ncbi:MAG: hypothetical protein Q8T13_19275 [Acidobacteriota bacterium]|nr:hypothetical protein [Acidobacteriota bacterium]
MPDTRVLAGVERVRLRMRVRNVVWSVTAGAATAGAVGMIVTLVGLSTAPRWLLAVVAGSVMAFLLTRRAGGATPARAADLIEREASLDNLIVTAAELQARPRPVRADIRAEIVRQAEARLLLVDATHLVPLRQPMAVMSAVLAGAFAVLTIGPESVPRLPGAIGGAVQASTRGIDSMAVHITPPAYSGRPAESLADPVQITVVAGSRIQLVAASAADGMVAEIAGQPPLTMTRAAEGFSGEWVAEQSTAVAIRPAGGEGRDVKFLSVIVVADAPPVVRMPQPGMDLAMSGTKGRITIGVDAQDDLGLASLSVRFTKASGGGESVTFTEGEVPLAITRSDGRHWRGRAEWVLDGLSLTDGDVLVYRAIARDRNPNGTPVQSDQYLIEVGRLAGAVGSGFALPAEEKKFAISQQMVIYKTEQLIASVKGKPTGDRGPDWLEQNQMLAIEQRMVRSEVVFLSGGEVQDEVEEAAHSHEIAEGRLENSGRAEMVRALNFMSRAETELNAGRAVAALALEREALKALERAFDRRRYFLRTLPERSRIDTTRRLTGNRTEARPWVRDRGRVEAPPGLARTRELMHALAAASNVAMGADAALAAKVAAIDPADASLQKAAVALATAADERTRREALWAAMQAVTAHAIKGLGSAGELHLQIDPLAGRLADEMAEERARSRKGSR